MAASEKLAVLRAFFPSPTRKIRDPNLLKNSTPSHAKIRDLTHVEPANQRGSTILALSFHTVEAPMPRRSAPGHSAL